MQKHRFITAAGAGSALAASLAIVATLFVPHAGSTVEAATIFASFKEAVGNAFEIKFENIGAEGIQVDGRVVVVFDPADKDLKPFQSHPQGVYIEVKARAGDKADADLRGLDVDATIVAVPGNEWAYVKLAGLPHAVLEETLVAAIVQGIAQNGVLVDLDGILQKEGFGLGAWTLSEKLLDIDMDGDDDSEEAQMRRMLLSILTGQATADEFRALVAMLEEAVSNVSVEETEPGLHVLTASGFDTGGDTKAQGLIGDMVLRVAYKEGFGLAWAKIEHVGQLDGTVHLEMTDMNIDDPLFDRERLAKDGSALRFNLSQLVNLAETLGDK